MSESEPLREPTKDELDSWDRRAARDVETRQWALIIALKLSNENLAAALPAAAKILRFVDPESEQPDPEEPPLDPAPMPKSRTH